MTRLSDYPESALHVERQEPRRGYDMEERYSRGGLSGWMIAGLALAGLGALAWYYLGPDLRRYMKIRNM